MVKFLKIHNLDLIITSIGFFWLGAIIQDSFFTEPCDGIMTCYYMDSSPAPYFLIALCIGFLLSYGVIRFVDKIDSHKS